MAEDTLGARLIDEIDRTSAENNVPGVFSEYLKDDLKKAFDVVGRRPVAYEKPYIPEKLSLAEFFTDPIGTTKELAVSVSGVKRLKEAVWGEELLATEDVQGSLEKLALDRLSTGWATAQGVPLLSGSLGSAFEIWVGSARKYGSRLKAESLLRGSPGLALVVARQLDYYASSVGVPSVVAGVALSGFIQEAGRVEGNIAACLANEDWAGASKIQGQWVKQWGAYQGKLIAEFERQIRDPSSILANTAEARFWRYWNIRNRYYYGTLNLLQTWHDDGFRGVLRQYAWDKLTKRLGLWYPPNLLKAIIQKTAGRALTPIMTKLTSWRLAIARFRKKWISGSIKWVSKKAFGGLVKKLSATKLGVWLGGVIGSIAPGVGNALGAVVGGVVTFLLELVVDKLGGILRLLLYTVGGTILLGLILFVMSAMFFVVLIALIFNTNAVFPTDVGGADPLFTPYSMLVTVTKEACEPAPDCADFKTPLRVGKDDTVHGIRWQITFENTSDEAQIVYFNDENCKPAGESGASESFTFNPGEVRQYYCDQNVAADDDKVVTNTVSGTVVADSAPASAVGVVIIGDPGTIYPMGWPVPGGCITQGPGGSYSHSGAQAVDIAAGTGTPVYSTHDGTVTAVRTGCPQGRDSHCGDGLGNHVRVRSDAGFTTIYAHLLDVSVGAGSQITFGQLIGHLDNTGRSTGPHLHYQFLGLQMRPPYIPISIGPCSGGEDCGGVCF